MSTWRIIHKREYSEWMGFQAPFLLTKPPSGCHFPRCTWIDSSRTPTIPTHSTSHFVQLPDMYTAHWFVADHWTLPSPYSLYTTHNCNGCGRCQNSYSNRPRVLYRYIACNAGSAKWCSRPFLYIIRAPHWIIPVCHMGAHFSCVLTRLPIRGYSVRLIHSLHNTLL